MPSRKQRAQIAAETVTFLEDGFYIANDQRVPIAESISSMLAGTVTFTPDDLRELVDSCDAIAGQNSPKIDVFNCTTFAAAKRLVDGGDENPLCLNFASAKNPGGGFQSGAQAQEECLARASTLYTSLIKDMRYYEVNRENGSSLYTNHMIYSPDVAVFRNDDDELLTDPYRVSIITSPAVNAGAIRKNEPNKLEQIRPKMIERMQSLFAVARKYGHRSIVLGAWGCGVFRNDPRDVASWFSEVLSDPRFQFAFDRVVFAVLDFAEETPTFRAFDDVFSKVDGNANGFPS